MPSTPSSSGEFHDGFDDFFNGEDEALPSLPREAIDYSSDFDDSDEESLPEIDLSSFGFEGGESIVEEEESDSDAEEYFDDDSWDDYEDSSPAPLNSNKIEHQDDSWEENIGYEDILHDSEDDDSYYIEEESWEDEETSTDESEESITDDELDELLNFDDDSWMDDDSSGDEGDGYYPDEEETNPEDEAIHLSKSPSGREGQDESWDEDEPLDDGEEDEVLLLDDEDDTPEESPEEEEDEEENPGKEGRRGASPWKSKFADFKRKAQAELQGNNSEDLNEEEDPEEEELLEEEETPPMDEEEVTDDEQGATRAPRRSNSSGPLGTLRNLAIFQLIGRLLHTRPLLFLGRILRPLKSVYLFVVNTILKALEWTLGLLGHIPVIGKPFRWMRDLTEVLRYIATCIPVVLFIILVVYLNRSAVPPKADASMPDEGHLTISSMSYDGDTKTAKGTIVNDGEIITQVRPKFTVYSSSPLNPISWAFPKKQMECVASPVKLEAGESRVVEAKCSQGAKGFFKKTTATLIAE